MVEYNLRVHSTIVIDPILLEPIMHTGYSLYVKNDDGTETLHTIDFSSDYNNSNAVINFGYGPAYSITDSYGNNTYWDSNDQNEINSNGLEVKNLLTGPDALIAYKKIKLNAALTNLATGIEYDMLLGDGRVCNTATNYWAEQYIPGYDNKLVTDELNGIF